ncbi:MAG: ABC transporter permease subunit [Desulfobacterales bacterium]|nr:ABC transporter permease subunit [Desulfobacterales bacterium]
MKKERFAETGFLGAAVLSASLAALILIFMLFLGFPLFREGYFFTLLTTPWNPDHGLFGIYPMLSGTLSIVFLSLCWAFPLSLGASALISVIAPPGFAKFCKKTVQMLTGIPTVIYGFVGVFLLVPFVREVFASGSGMSILSASFMLSMVISPTMILIFTDTFESIPASYSAAADALGASPVQKFVYVILPYSRHGIFAGLILSVGRAMGDTLIALMLAGNAVAVPGSILDSARTLTAHIALVIAADFDSIEFKTIFAAGLVLYAFTAFIILLVRIIGSAGIKNR